MTREYVVKIVAGLLGVKVSFPRQEEEDARQQPKNKEYRLSRRVWYNGTVHWVIEQYISSQSTLRELFPDYPTDKMVHVNGEPLPRNWIPLPKDFGSEEEAIQYLNETLRSCEVMEATHYYID